MSRLDRLRCALGLLLMMLLPAVGTAGELAVEDARVRLLPGEVPAAGYFTLRNGGDAAAVLVGAGSPAFERVMMHRTVQEGQQTRMEHVPRLRVEPGEALRFAPGGYHLMLMDRRQPLQVGDEVSVTLELEDGRRLPVTFRAVALGSL